MITLHGVIWTVEQGRSEGMSEPVITLQGGSLLRPHASICGPQFKVWGEGDQSMGVARVHSCVRAWSSYVMWHCVCSVWVCWSMIAVAWSLLLSHDLSGMIFAVVARCDPL